MQLMRQQPDGATLRAHLQAAHAAGAPLDARLASTPPPAARALWHAFVELAGARPAGMGVSAIPFGELEAWQRLHGVRFTPWEVETIVAMDHAALNVLRAPSSHDVQPGGHRA